MYIQVKQHRNHNTFEVEANNDPEWVVQLLATLQKLIGAGLATQGASVNGCCGQVPHYASGIEPAPDSSLHSLASTLGNGFAIQSSEEENPGNIIFSFC